jgi:hypothetical protein
VQCTQLDNAGMSSPPPALDAQKATLHVLVPWATCLLPDCETAWPTLDQLPHVSQVLRQLSHTTWLHGDEYAPSPPHEVLWGQALGWPVTMDGPVPWGAHLAREVGLIAAASPPSAWGLITPCHWAMGHSSLTVLPLDETQVSEADSRALFDAARPLFESEGWHLHWVTPLQWLANHGSLADMPAASLDRVLGRNPDVWMPSHEQTRLTRRLQAEVQMLWYEHPVNNQREQQGQKTINSFWLSGCGLAPANTLATPELVVANAPRQALLQMDVAAWLAAWQALDRDTMPQCLSAMAAGQRVQLSLCGERHAVTCQAPPAAPWWGRAMRSWRRHEPSLSRLSSPVSSAV